MTSSGRWDSVVQEIRRMAGLSAAALLPDRELLESFVGRHDQAAFEVLVRRYGSMVFGVCKRILRHAQDAEDAFQATFLVLVRKAASLRRGETVANWLYGVAYRTALQARTRSARRRRHEALVPPMEHEESSVEIAARVELQALLDRELNRLPDKYRTVIVLCDLLGKTKKQVAEELHCPEGTVSSRLAYGRELLKKRLARYGSAFGGTAGAVLLDQTATAAIPAGLCSTTIKAAALIAKGTTTAAGLTPNVVSLVEGVIKSMLLTKLKPVVALMLAASLLGGVAWVVASGTGGADPASAPAQPNAKKDAPQAGSPAIVVADNQKKKELLYADKDFNGWRDTLHTQLKPELRIEAIKAIAAFGVNGHAEQAATALLEMIATYQYHLRTPSATYTYPVDPIIKAIRLIKDEDDDKVVNYANKALDKIGPLGFPALVKAQQSTNVNERQAAAQSLHYLLAAYPDDAFSLFLRALKDKDNLVRRWALNAAFFRSDVRVRWDPNDPVDSPEKKTIAALTIQEKKDLVGGLTASFKDKDGGTRQGALILLHEYKLVGESEIQPILNLVREDEENRREAVRVLKEIGPQAIEQVIPLLVKICCDEPDNFGWAYECLCESIPEGNSLPVPVLMALAKSIPGTAPVPLLELRQFASEALKKIGK